MTRGDAPERRRRRLTSGSPAEPPGVSRRALDLVQAYLPRGNTLDEATFQQRHSLLCWVLALHIPSLFAFGVWQGYGVSHSALEVAVPTACVGFARLARNRRLAGFFVTAGLVYCSSVLVHLSGGTIEAHFHFFILIGLIALYQDWVPFLWNVTFTVLSHGVGSTIAADLMFNHDAAQNRPWSWAVIHGVSVLAACVGVVIFWKHTELVQQRNTHLAADLASVQATAAQRQSVSELFVNLARRNQSLLDRQLDLIAELEQRERAPDALADLFKLDHLATRIRRNAESLLVLSGEEAPRRWGRPIALADVVRAAAAEVEDFGRVEVLVNDHLVVAGRVVADLAHLLAELIENATTFSPPGADVRVVSHLAPGPASHLLSIEDVGVGMAPETLAAANVMLADPPEVDLRQPRLGLHVVGRLAQRYGISVQLATTPGGGVTALVTLPDDLVNERLVNELVPAGAAVAPMASSAPGSGGAPPRPSSGPVPRIPSAPAPNVVAPWATAAPVAGAPIGPTPVGPAPSRPPPPAPSPVGQRPMVARPPTFDPRVPPAAPAAPLPPLPTVPAAHSGMVGSGPPVEAPVAQAGSPEGGDDAASTTVDGLVRRVPGASLAPSLRRSPSASGQTPSIGPRGATPGGSGGGPGSQERDAERMRTMLSRFQSRQRAGRIAAQAHQAVQAEQITEATTHKPPHPQEDA